MRDCVNMRFANKLEELLKFVQTIANVCVDNITYIRFSEKILPENKISPVHIKYASYFFKSKIQFNNRSLLIKLYTI